MFGRKESIRDFENEALPHGDVLFRTALRLVGDRDAAQDLVQDVYVQAWKSFDRYQRGTNCRAWLFRILFNKLQHIRRARATRKVVSIGENQEHLLEDLPSSASAIEEIRDEEILAAIDAIPEEFRAVVLLADVQEFAYREVAEILEIPIGTVMSRLSRGRKLLRVRLREQARDFGIRTERDDKKE